MSKKNNAEVTPLKSFYTDGGHQMQRGSVEVLVQIFEANSQRKLEEVFQ